MYIVLYRTLPRGAWWACSHTFNSRAKAEAEVDKHPEWAASYIAFVDI